MRYFVIMKVGYSEAMVEFSDQNEAADYMSTTIEHKKESANGDRFEVYMTAEKEDA